MKVRLKTKLSAAKFIHFTTDNWTNNHNPYMSLTLHLVDDNFDMKSYTAGLTFVPQSHTSEYLRTREKNPKHTDPGRRIRRWFSTRIVSKTDQKMRRLVTKINHTDKFVRQLDKWARKTRTKPTKRADLEKHELHALDYETINEVLNFLSPIHEMTCPVAPIQLQLSSFLKSFEWNKCSKSSEQGAK